MTFLKKYFLVIFLIFLLVLFFKPVFFDNKTVLSGNFLVAFFNPWAPEKLPDWPQGVPYKPVGSDDLRIFYPQRAFTQEMFSVLQLPFWNPYSFSGNYHLGLSETAIFYPPFLLFSLLPQQTGWIILIFVQPILAFVGMYLFLQLFFTKKTYPLFGAFVFGFSGLVLVRMVEGLSVGHSFIWLPFALWAIESYLQRGKTRFLLYLLLAMMVSVFAGWFQFSFYLIVCSFLFALWRMRTTAEINIKKRVFVLFPFLLLPFLTLPHTIPAFETFLFSPRGGITSFELQQHLMPITHLFTLLYADYWGNPATFAFLGKSEYKEYMMYVGTVPFLLTFFSLHFRKNHIVQFFLFLTGISLLFGLDTPVSQLLLSIKIPVLSSFLPDRIFALTTVSLAVLAAFGMKFVIESKNMFWKGRVARLLFIMLSITLLFNVLAVLREPIVTLLPFMEGNVLLPAGEREQVVQVRNMMLGNAMIAAFFILLMLRKFLRKNGLFIFLFIVTIAGQLYFSYKYLSFSEKQFVFPQHNIFSFLQQQGLYRFITAGEGLIMSEIPLLYRVYSPDGVSSMYPKRYGELVTYAIFSGADERIPRIETRINPQPEALLLENHAYLTRFMQIDGIKYVLVRKDEFTLPGEDNKQFHDMWQLAWEDSTWQIYAYNHVLPRYFWTDSFSVVNNDQELLSQIFTSKENPKHIFLEKDPGFVSESNGKGEVVLKEYSPNQITFHVKADNNGLLYLSDTYSPNFRAYIDGVPKEILRANYTFRAVPVEKGTHEVMLRYEDTPFLVGSIISVVTGISLLILILFLKKSKRILW